ncbi:MAG TPA: CAP domain-containing protein [Candidatus Moranbacteria bacterium]|nr:CAP domain-containing protein [Candidatus Moranbacteria bacterium]HSA08266.1 CAP domain-containing protein [Candidatus Moranbacteria bacterium]
MLHVTTARKTNHHKKAIAVEIFFAIAMLAVFFVPASQASDITSNMVILLVNKARSATNVTALKKNDLLQQAAEEKAQDMINNNYFAHVSPQKKSPWYWIEKNEYDYTYAGENLAINFTNSEDQQEAWMESPLHKKNILNPNYDEIGVAVKQGIVEGKETTVVVQMFGAQAGKEIAGASYDKENVDNSEAQAKVAGLQSENADNISAEQKMDLSVFFKNNAPTLIGWGALFSLAIVIIIIDIAAIIHKRHKPFFLLRENKTH